MTITDVDYPPYWMMYKKIFLNSDFIKMDVEGEEAKIILSTTKKDWENVDMVMEVGTKKNAEVIYCLLYTSPSPRDS